MFLVWKTRHQLLFPQKTVHCTLGLVIRVLQVFSLVEDIKRRLCWLNCPTYCPRWGLGNFKYKLLYLNSYLGPADVQKGQYRHLGRIPPGFLTRHWWFVGFTQLGMSDTRLKSVVPVVIILLLGSLIVALVKCCITFQTDLVSACQSNHNQNGWQMICTHMRKFTSSKLV